VKIALIIEGEFDGTHGTGVFARRVFGCHQHLLTISLSSQSKVAASTPSLWSGARRIGQGVTRRLRRVARRWENQRKIELYRPDVIVSLAYSNSGLELVEDAVKSAPGVPVILWVLDLLFSRLEGDSLSVLDRIAPVICEVWILAPEMKGRLQSLTSNWRRDLSIKERLHWPVQRTGIDRKIRHREFSNNFRVIMLGNVWNASMLASLKTIWTMARVREETLRPIEWICHRTGYERVTAAVGPCEPEILWREGVGDVELPSVLASADLALVPFALDLDSDYAKYSIPSRIGDLASVGLPIAVIAPEGSATANYVKSFGMAELITDASSTSVDRLLGLAVDLPRRRALSDSAMSYAEKYLGPAGYLDAVFADIESCVFAAVQQSRVCNRI
jgi:hypothetical protein